MTKQPHIAAKLWAVLKFTLLAKRGIVDIDEEIEQMVAEWTRKVDPSGRTANELRAKLHALVREGIEEDIEAENRKWH